MPVFWLFISTSVYASCSSEEMTPDNGDGEKTGRLRKNGKKYGRMISIIVILLWIVTGMQIMEPPAT